MLINESINQPEKPYLVPQQQKQQKSAKHQESKANFEVDNNIHFSPLYFFVRERDGKRREREIMIGKYERKKRKKKKPILIN